MVRGLDDDEARFLDFVDKTKLAKESLIMKQENEEIEEYRLAVAKENERLLAEVKPIASSNFSSKCLNSSGTSDSGTSKTSQKACLQSLIKRKGSGIQGAVKKIRSEGNGIGLLDVFLFFFTYPSSF